MPTQAKIFSIKVSTGDRARGARIRSSGRAIQGWVMITVRRIGPSHGSLYFYASNLRGSRSYKLAFSDPRKSSPGMTVKAVARTRTVHLDRWSVTFVRGVDFERLVAALRRAGFLAEGTSTALPPRGQGFEVVLETEPRGKSSARAIEIKKGRVAFRGKLHLFTGVGSPTGLFYGLSVRRRDEGRGAFKYLRKRVDLNQKKSSDEIELAVVARSKTLRLDGWTLTCVERSTFAALVDALRSEGFLDPRGRLQVAARKARRGR